MNHVSSWYAPSFDVSAMLSLGGKEPTSELMGNVSLVHTEASSRCTRSRNKISWISLNSFQHFPVSQLSTLWASSCIEAIIFNGHKWMYTYLFPFHFCLYNIPLFIKLLFFPHWIALYQQQTYTGIFSFMDMLKTYGIPLLPSCSWRWSIAMLSLV